MTDNGKCFIAGATLINAIGLIKVRIIQNNKLIRSIEHEYRTGEAIEITIYDPHKIVLRGEIPMAKYLQNFIVDDLKLALTRLEDMIQSGCDIAYIPVVGCEWKDEIFGKTLYYYSRLVAHINTLVGLIGVEETERVSRRDDKQKLLRSLRILLFATRKGLLITEDIITGERTPNITDVEIIRWLQHTPRVGL